MRFERIICVLVLVLLFHTHITSAQAPSHPAGEFNVGYSFLSRPHFDGHGFQIGIAVNALSWFGLVGQFDAFPFHSDHTPDMYVTTGGPRFSWRFKHVTPYAQFLIGGMYSRFQGVTDGDFALKYGAGIDFAITKRFVWRIEGDDLVLVKPKQHFFNLSTGIALRWY